MQTLKLGLIVTAIYIAIVALAFTLIAAFRPGVHGAVEIIYYFWAVELGLTVLTACVAWRYFGWRKAGFGRLDWRALVWMIPAFWTLAVMFSALWPALQTALTPDQYGFLGLLLLTTFLIGFSEELMFRGLLLRSALTRLGQVQAMMLSALAFSALHAFNGFIGQSLGDTVQHLAFTFVIGLALALIALKIGNLWPLIIWHWLWNFVLFAGFVWGVVYPYALGVILIQFVLSIWLWTEKMRQT